MIDKGQHCLPFSCPEFVQGLVDFDEDLASVLKLATNCITLKHRICGCTLHPWDMDTLHMDFPLCNNSPSLSASLSYTWVIPTVSFKCPSQMGRNSESPIKVCQNLLDSAFQFVVEGNEFHFNAESMIVTHQLNFECPTCSDMSIDIVPRNM
jgi:hypothetical protein